MKGTWKKFAVIMKYLEFLAAGYLLDLHFDKYGKFTKS